MFANLREGGTDRQKHKLSNIGNKY